MSAAERQVADFLSELKIWWNYEQPVIVKDEGDRQRNWYPDFFLSEFGVYVEVCGADRKNDYDRRKECYKKNRLSVIFVQTYKDEGKWKEYLLNSILDIQRRREEILFSTLVDKVFSPK